MSRVPCLGRGASGNEQTVDLHVSECEYKEVDGKLYLVGRISEPLCAVKYVQVSVSSVAVVETCKFIRDILWSSVAISLRGVYRQYKEKTYPSDNKSKVLRLQILHVMIQVQTPLHG